MSAMIDENRKAIADITAPKDTISRIFKRLDDQDDLLKILVRGRPPP